MKKLFICSPLFIFSLCTLSGCGMIGAKTASISVIYGTTTILSLFVLISYCLLGNKKDVWFLLLFSSVLVVNIGYFSLSISKTLEEGLLANRISYLGSVFLPMTMLIIILNTIHLQYKKWFPAMLFAIGLLVFLIAASPGYLDIYYKEVSLEVINGVSILNKTYGSWHCLYLFYLLIYFTVMVAAIIHATAKRVIDSPSHAIILLLAVFVNIGVWLIEQIVKIDFEVLAVSYIISELFLLGLHIVMTENQKLKETINVQTNFRDPGTPINLEVEKSDKPVKEIEPAPFTSATDSIALSEEEDSLHLRFLTNITKLTKTEHIIFDFYIAGKTTKEIMGELCITENTLKFHNKNIYSKLEVSSRKQLFEIYSQIKSK